MDLASTLKQHIRAVPDFPIPGILFRDISPIFLQPRLLDTCVAALAAPWQEAGITKVIGIDSRGFLFGPQLAVALNAGFVMVRKKGKLPPETISVTYELEYGNATLESVREALQPGDRVLIHDDLLATGGTAAAAASLAAKLGATPVGFSFLVDLTYLDGQRQLLPYGGRIHSLVQFDV
ncbi:MAG: adenine phosphoribosyltransferase [Bacteroidia bacterium]